MLKVLYFNIKTIDEKSHVRNWTMADEDKITITFNEPKTPKPVEPKKEIKKEPEKPKEKKEKNSKK